MRSLSGPLALLALGVWLLTGCGPTPALRSSATQNAADSPPGSLTANHADVLLQQNTVEVHTTVNVHTGDTIDVQHQGEGFLAFAHDFLRVRIFRDSQLQLLKEARLADTTPLAYRFLLL